MLTPQQIDFLNSAYNKDVLQSAWLPYVKKFVLANRNKQYGDVRVDDIVKLIQSKNTFNKQELMTICFSVLQNEAIYKSFIATLPSYMPEIIEQLLWEESMGRQEAEKITGSQLLLSEGNSFYSDKYKTLPGLNMLQVTVHSTYYYSWDKKPWNERYKDMIIYIALPPALKNVIVPYYPQPEGFTIKPVAEPAMPGLQVFNAETFIIPELQRSFAYYLQHNIKYSEKGKPNPAGMNKMQRSLGITEFFTDKSFSHTRTLMIAGLLYGYKNKNIQVDAAAAIKLLFEENYIDPGNRYAPVPPYILTQLKGIGYPDWHEYKKEVNRNILEVIKALPVEQWITAENIITYVKTHFLDIRPLNDWTIRSKLYYDTKQEDRYGTTRRNVTDANMSKLVDIPYLKGNLFLFAAFGLLAVSYTEPATDGQFAQDWYSEYDGIQAVKLTHLGAYVLGIEKEYQPAVGEPAAKLVFDENTLLVRAEGDTQLMNTLIGNYLEKISSTRYVFNAGYFLKDCGSAADIKNKIAIFKQAAGTPLPPLWNDYLQSLVSNTKAINQQSDVVVFQLSAADKALQQLIVQDSVLKKLVLKAELFHILVLKDNLAKFKSRMKELGYLV